MTLFDATNQGIDHMSLRGGMIDVEVGVCGFVF